jgi:hypothetical protein
MDTYLALSLVVVILVVTAAAVSVISLVTDRRLFHGYREIRSEALFLAKELRGRVVRRDHDLVVSGSHGDFPVEVRISKNDYTPELTIRMSTPPLPLRISVQPKAIAQGEDGRPVTISDPYLSSRFAVFSDSPDLAGFLLARDTATKDLRRLCWSTRNCVLMTVQRVEVIEAKLPDSALGLHCLDHVSSLARLAAMAQELPGTKIREAPKIPPNRHLVGRAATGIAAIVAFAALLSTGRSPQASPAITSARTQAESVPPQDASRIPGASAWRVAAAADYDPMAVQWLRQKNQSPSGRLVGDFSGAASGRDVAYVLTRTDGTFRLVMLIGNATACDIPYPYVEVAAVIPKDRFASIAWVDGRLPSPDGDGLLIVLDKHDVSSGLVLFRQAGTLFSARPVDYRSISLD